jgi:hypothetical protein
MSHMKDFFAERREQRVRAQQRLINVLGKKRPIWNVIFF